MNIKKIIQNQKVSDTSWNRLNYHMKHAFFICSPFRSEYSYEVNKQRWMQFAKTLKNLGLGYIVMNGSWTETDNQGNQVKAFEFSAFVPKPKNFEGDFKQVALDLADSFQQEGVILKETDDAPIDLYYNEGGTWTISGVFTRTLLSEQDFNDFYSKIYSGRDSNLRFKFVDTFRASGMVEAMHALDQGIIL